jgi:hypothetical protein
VRRAPDGELRVYRNLDGGEGEFWDPADVEGSVSAEALATALTAQGVVLSNVDAEADPTVNDDVTLGYAQGSYWVNATTQSEFYCVSAADGAAVWRPIQRRPPLFSGRALRPAHMIDGSISTVTAGRFYVPFDIAPAIAFNAWAVRLGTAVASAVCKGAIYSTDANGKPGTVLTTLPEIDLSTGGTSFRTQAITWTNPYPGLFWVGIATNNPSTATLLRLGSNIAHGFIHGTLTELGAAVQAPRAYTSGEAYATAFASNPTVTASFSSDVVVPHLQAA